MGGARQGSIGTILRSADAIDLPHGQGVPKVTKVTTTASTAEQTVGKKFYRGRGCEKCHNSGYKGRLGLYELLIMTDELRDMVIRNASTEERREVARKGGMVTLRDSGMLGIFDGQTTADEVIRETILEA